MDNVKDLSNMEEIDLRVALGKQLGKAKIILAHGRYIAELERRGYTVRFSTTFSAIRPFSFHKSLKEGK